MYLSHHMHAGHDTCHDTRHDTYYEDTHYDTYYAFKKNDNIVVMISDTWPTRLDGAAVAPAIWIGSCGNDSGVGLLQLGSR